MAPDADRLRQRRTKTFDDLAESDATEPVLRISTLKTLGETEIVIDGAIYDIKNFNHPGGDTILMFGGNDCTVQYKMIHHYHSKKHLEKMERVGTIPDYSSE